MSLDQIFSILVSISLDWSQTIIGKEISELETRKNVHYSGNLPEQIRYIKCQIKLEVMKQQLMLSRRKGFNCFPLLKFLTVSGIGM